MFDLKGIEKGEFVEYKGRPLVRKDDDLYYGDLSKYYVKMMVMTEKNAKNGESIPDIIVVQLFEPGTLALKRQFNAKMKEQNLKRVYYLCMEFLVGRSLKTNLYNLGLVDEYAKVLKKYKIDIEDVYEQVGQKVLVILGVENGNSK